MTRSGLARAYDGLHSVLGVMTAILIAVMALMISTDVVMRNVGLGSIPWSLELAEYLQFVAVFLGAPWVLRLGAHVRVDVVLQAVPRPIARALDVLANIAGAAISTALLWFAGVVGFNAYEDGARVIKSFIFPEWWLFALVAFSGALLLIEFARRLWSLRPAQERATSSI